MCEHTTAFVTPKGDPVCRAISIRKFKGSETSYTHCHGESARDAAATTANMQLLCSIFKEERRHIVSSGLTSH